jgi:putative Holliday junction resolvase
LFRIIGIDYGVKRIGLAVTDPLQIFASPLMTVMTTEFYKFITGYLETDDVDAFVIGYPVQMNNQPSASVTYINPFIKRLKKTYPEKHIYLADERFTSQMAIRTMVEGGVKKRDRQDKSMVDKISASIILQSFLDNRSNKKENIKQE